MQDTRQTQATEDIPHMDPPGGQVGTRPLPIHRPLEDQAGQAILVHLPPTVAHLLAELLLQAVTVMDHARATPGVPRRPQAHPNRVPRPLHLQQQGDQRLRRRQHTPHPQTRLHSAIHRIKINLTR